jgi:hypothetical protein
LTNWRRTRNKIVHDNYKIPPSAAKKAKTFFDAFETQLIDILQQIDEGAIVLSPSPEEETKLNDETKRNTI